MLHLYFCTRGPQPAMRLLWTCLLLAAWPAFAQPVLVKDIHPQPGYPGKAAYVTLNGSLYFTATTAAHGAELFRSDPKAENAVLVKDINPGPKSSSPGELTLLGDAFLFTAVDGLYRSDGTETGTVRLKELGSWPQSLVNADGTAFFAVAVGDVMQVWKSNGTAAGTTLVKEVGTVFNPYATFKLTPLGGNVFFPAYDDTRGLELWKSDGTAAGTTLVKDIYPGTSADPESPGPNGSAPGSITAFGGAVYFAADDGVHGRELWKSNGTAAGTTLVKDLAAPESAGGFGDGNAMPSQLTVTDNALFFVTNPIWYGSEVYKTDGTDAGTVLLAAYYPPRPGPVSSVFGMTAVGNTVYYGETTYSPSFGTSVGLYKTDGTTAGTSIVYDFSGGATNSDGFVDESVLGNFTPINGTLYFTANNGLTGSEVWKTDASGTVYLPEVAPGPAPSNPTRLVDLNGVLFFNAGSDPQVTPQWKYDTRLPFTPTLRINAGGPEAYSEVEPEFPSPLVPSLYYYFAPDRYFSGGNVTNPKPDDPVSGSVYDSRRWGAFSYNIPVTKGTYQVVLHFAEPYWGVRVPGGVGSRKFNVDLEGSRKLTEYDIFAKAGGSEVPIRETYTVEVTDGTLNIAFSRGSADNAILSALEVLPTIATNRAPAITAIGNKTGNVDEPLAFTVEATDPDGDALQYELQGGPEGAVIDPKTGAFAFVPTQVGTFTFTVKVTDNGYPAAAAEEPFTILVKPAIQAVRVNAGGTGFTTADGRTFAADAYFSGGTVSRTTPLGIGGTTDDYLYQTGRHSASFSYNIPVGDGSYDVVLHFAETYWGNVVPGGAGSRGFHVDLEGTRRLTEYDIFARAGGALKVVQETFRVTVSDGTLNVNFLKGAADNPAVKAIEVLPAGGGLTINAGGEALRTAGGKRFSADSYYAAGRGSTLFFGDIDNTDDDALYVNGRVGTSFSYALPSGNGTFDVTLHFAETYWGNQAAGGVGSRRFHVDLEGVRRLTNYDIFAKAGGALRATTETFRVTVTDGILNLLFARGSADLPLVSAIEVTLATVAARTATAEARGETIHLYPNPARATLTVALPFPAAGVTGSAVVTATGRELLRDGHRVKGEYELEIPVGHLDAGLYLLRIQSPTGRQVLRFVKGE
ncbi:MAG: T9SS type A sorting domain-containing protein [Cytophagales bacterium]|nr:T9SS type A sorting domain-containing protein [Cytophagales bacterium]